MIYNNPQYIGMTSYAPTVTLVGGSDTVPVYSTNTGLYTLIGNKCFVSVYLTGDGGAEGAGTTGQMNIALPIAANASQPTGSVNVGDSINNTTFTQIFGQVAGSATTIALGRINAGTLAIYTGADQNNATRILRLEFSYFI